VSVKHASAQGLERYQDDRFGMFVHWGLYSLVGASEWLMFHDRYSVADYELLAQQFTAPHFDADSFVRTAADAGQRYLTITSRHHDGFSMYDTALSDYKVTRTPFGRDPIAELAEACSRHNVRIGFYVSLVDWHHPAYRETLRRKSGLAWNDYVEFLHGQVRELCTNYGDVAQFWLDGYWPVNWPWLQFPNWFAPSGDFRLEELLDLVHTLQPDAVIMNNRHSEPIPGEDVQGYEGDVPGENTHDDLNGTPPMREALETCQTLTSSGYGFQKHDHKYRSTSELLTMLARAAASGANFLLNVGPTPDGEITAPAQDRLRHLGEWLRTNGEGIYGTRAGTLMLSDETSEPPAISGVASTRSARTSAHYVHILDGSVPTSIFIDLPPGEHADEVTATLLRDGGEVPVELLGDGDTLRLTVPADRRDGLATTVRLHFS
jgi:alpha-L-fucosidase